MSQVQLTEEETKLFLPFYEHLNRKRLAIDSAQREFIEYILSSRKAPNEPNQQATNAHATGSAEQHDASPPSDSAANANYAATRGSQPAGKPYGRAGATNAGPQSGPSANAAGADARDSSSASSGANGR
jgi:hypothetical protein